MAELDRAAICARIAQARTEAGLTQDELGDLLGVHYRTVQTWESMKQPRVPWDRLDEIARATGKTKEWLLHDGPAPVTVLDGDRRQPTTADSLAATAARLEATAAEFAGLLAELSGEIADQIAKQTRMLERLERLQADPGSVPARRAEPRSG